MKKYILLYIVIKSYKKDIFETVITFIFMTFFRNKHQFKTHQFCN